MITKRPSEALLALQLAVAPATAPIPALSAAEVIRVDRQQLLVSLGVLQIDAQLAVLDYDPQPGDRVLVIGQPHGEAYVIGVLSTVSPRPRLRVETNPENQATRVVAEQGDLEFVARRGNVRTIAGGSVETLAVGSIQFTSGVSVCWSLANRLGKTLRRLALTHRALEIDHTQVDVTAEKLTIDAQRSQWQGEELDVNVTNAKVESQRVDARVGTLLSSIDNAYQQVTGLWQLLADRTRMVVKGTSHHMAQRLYSKADDVKIKADKIHLG